VINLLAEAIACDDPDRAARIIRGPSASRAMMSCTTASRRPGRATATSEPATSASGSRARPAISRRDLHRAVRFFSGASPALHLQDVPQAVRHAWYATGGPHKRKQAKHNKQRKPASNRGTHHPLPPARRGPRNLTAPPKRSFVCDPEAVKPLDSRAIRRRPSERRRD